MAFAEFFPERAPVSPVVTFIHMLKGRRRIGTPAAMLSDDKRQFFILQRYK